MSDYISVKVRRNGDEVVTIETGCLSGRDISPEDEAAIQWAALQLLAFIGAAANRDTSDAGNQQPSGLRGDPGANRTTDDGTRDRSSSSSTTCTSLTPKDWQPKVQALIAKLDAFHHDPSYHAIVLTAHVHGVEYHGPTYAAELADVRALIAPPTLAPATNE